MKIEDIFETRLSEKIEPVIRVGETLDPRKLASEIGNFVVTPTIESYMDSFLEQYSDTFRKRTTEIGVWISGYFGSGKSHLAKMMALVTENRDLGGTSAADRFNARVPNSAPKKKSIGSNLSLLRNCNTRVLAFNLNTLTDSRNAELPKLLLSQYYQSRGYGRNYIFARVIESGLDKLGKLPLLHQEIENRTGKSWHDIQSNIVINPKHLYQAVCQVAPELFSSPDEVRKALEQSERGEIYNIEFLVKTVLDDIQTDERLTGIPSRVFFVLDESGQWIEDRQDRLAQLQALVEEAAGQGQGKIWVLVTTHEDMGAIFRNAHALDTDFKKMEGRFRFKFGLTTENIELVLEDRIFKKTLAGKKEVESLYQDQAGIIRSMGELSGVSQKLPECSLENFVKFYPFFPYQIHLIPEIVKTLRAKGGRSESLSGSTRTLLAITQDVIRAGRRNYLQETVGTSVSFDEIYFNLTQEGEISSEIRRELSKIRDVVPDATDLTSKCAEILFLTGELNYLPRTAGNLSRMLVSDTSQDLAQLQPRIEMELEKLKKAKIVSAIGDEWEFLTGVRRSFEESVDAVSTQLKFQDREKGLDDLITTHMLGFETIPFKGYDFPVQIFFDQKVLSKRGHIKIHIISPFARYTGKDIREYENESLKPENQQSVYIFCDRIARFGDHLDRYIAMKEVAESWSKPNKSVEERELANTRATTDIPKLKSHVENDIRLGLKQGHIIFRGASRAVVPKNGQSPGEAVRQEIAHYFGTLYPKYDKCTVRIKSDQQDIVDVLGNEKNLSAEVKSLKLYDAGGQLNPHQPVIDEIRVYLTTRQNRKERIIQNEVLTHFESPPYGWDSNAVRIGIAAMVRAGWIKIGISKKNYTNPADSELITALRNSKMASRIELILEDIDVRPEVLTAVRALLIRLTGSRKIDETPSDITVAGQNYLNSIKTKGDAAQIWANAADFPLPEAFQSGMESIKTLLGLTSPTHHVGGWEARSETIENEMKTILDVHAFYTKGGNDFKEVRELFVALQDMKTKIPSGKIIHHFLDNFSSAQTDASIHHPDNWKRLQDNQAHVLTEVEELKRGWKQDAESAIQPLEDRITEMMSSGRLTSPESEPFQSAIQEMISEIHAVDKLNTAVWLPENIQNKVTTQIKQLEQLVRSKIPDPEPDPEHEPDLPPIIPIKRIRLIVTPRKIRSLSEWEELKQDMDNQIKMALNQGNEVELMP